jgi:hypothetical protein
MQTSLVGLDTGWWLCRLLACALFALHHHSVPSKVNFGIEITDQPVDFSLPPPNMPPTYYTLHQVAEI